MFRHQSQQHWQEKRFTSKQLTSKQRRGRFRRLVEETLEPRILLAANGGDLRHLRLAVTATEEYTDFFGSRTAAQEAIAATVAGANKVFNDELNLQLDLIDNLDIVFGPGNSPDPFPTGGPGFTENQILLDTVIGSAGYDVGIIFGGLAIGLAELGSAGIDGSKAKAYTGFTPAEGGPAGGNAIDNVLHEMGHQLAAAHTFNGTLDTCSSAARNAATAFEPGSGTTLDGYAGICGGDNVQTNSNFYYHAGSLDQIIAHLESLDAMGVGTKDLGVNSVPTVSAGPDFTIPAGTPFQINVTGNDADDPTGESLLFNVEQMDTGPAQTLDPFPGDNGSSPLFRSFPPAPAENGSFTRVFPQLSDVLSGSTTKGEYLPTMSRELNFRATVRDGEGGTNSDDVKLTVVAGSPFAITSHGAAATLAGGTSSTVTWDVAGTTGGGIDTAAVNIWLSTDGGQTFPHLLANTDNDGSHSITVPNLDASKARIKVEGDGNIFFDISDADLTIVSDSDAAGVTVTNSVFVGEGGTFSPLTDTYTLTLNTAALSSVDITIDAGPGLEVSTDGAPFASPVTFTLTDTSPQTVTVRAIDNGKSNGAREIAISHSISASSDPAYPTDLIIDQVFVGVADNEQPPLIGVDFQMPRDPASLPPNPALSVPRNWTEVNGVPFFFTTTEFPNLIREDGVATSIGLTIDPTGGGDPANGSVSGSRTADVMNPLTAPMHSPDLNQAGGSIYFDQFFDMTGATSLSIDATWTGLAAFESYNVYVLGVESIGTSFTGDPWILNQTVTISGADGDLPSFLQNSTGRQRNLLVNGEEGDDSRTLESFAVPVTARMAGDGTGEININFLRDDGMDANKIIISGLAIQPVSDVIISSPPGFSKEFAPDSIDVGGTSALTFTIDNAANSVAATSLDFSDTLPAGVIVGTPPDASTTCIGGTLTATAGSSVISYSGGTVGAAASCTVSIDVTSSTAAAYPNTSGPLTSSLGTSGTASDTLTVNEPVVLLDFGDAPTATQSFFLSDYPTSLPDGARHTTSALTLGAAVDSEGDGQPTVAADGDGADEDGVRFVTSAVTTTTTATTASVLVTASAPGKLDAWIDFSRDGDWLDGGEKLFATSVDLVAGPNIVSYTVPAGASVGDTYARFRISSAGGLDSTGPADDGEVEDYRLTILDGGSPIAGEIDMLVGDLEVIAEGSDVVYWQDGVEVFRAPGSTLASTVFLGTDGDDSLRLGNLTSALATPIPLIYDGGTGRDLVTLIDSGQSLDLTDTALSQLSNIEVIDIVGASPNALKLDGPSVIAATDGSDTLLVVHDDDDTVDYSGWLGGHSTDLRCRPTASCADQQWRHELKRSTSCRSRIRCRARMLTSRMEHQPWMP